MTHVFIADDETHTRISLTFILESIGYIVTGAADGREALDKILALRESSHPVDLLVSRRRDARPHRVATPGCAKGEKYNFADDYHYRVQR